jgi:hypothetical protein
MDSRGSIRRTCPSGSVQRKNADLISPVSDIRRRIIGASVEDGEVRVATVRC